MTGLLRSTKVAARARARPACPAPHAVAMVVVFSARPTRVDPPAAAARLSPPVPHAHRDHPAVPTEAPQHKWPRDPTAPASPGGAATLRRRHARSDTLESERARLTRAEAAAHRGRAGAAPPPPPPAAGAERGRRAQGGPGRPSTSLTFSLSPSLPLPLPPSLTLSLPPTPPAGPPLWRGVGPDAAPHRGVGKGRPGPTRHCASRAPRRSAPQRREEAAGGANPARPRGREGEGPARPSLLPGEGGASLSLFGLPRASRPLQMDLRQRPRSPS